MSAEKLAEPPDYEHDDFDDECWNCNGDGFVTSCFEEWACVDPEGGCDLCTRRCDVCQPLKRNPELDAVLSEALLATRPSGGGV